jgi:hypothetical protein
MTNLDCLRCKSRMEAGFIVDHGHGNATQEQEWVEGDVVKSFWRGVHTHDRDKAKSRHVSVPAAVTSSRT